MDQEKSGGYLNIFFEWVWSEELQEIATKETSIKRKDEELADDRRKMEADVAAKGNFERWKNGKRGQPRLCKSRRMRRPSGVENFRKKKVQYPRR